MITKIKKIRKQNTTINLAQSVIKLKGSKICSQHTLVTASAAPKYTNRKPITILVYSGTTRGSQLTLTAPSFLSLKPLPTRMKKHNLSNSQ